MEYILIIVLILFNVFFTMCEIALVSSKKAKQESMTKEGGKRAVSALKLLGEPEKFLSAIQKEMTLVIVLAGAYGGPTIAHKLTPFVEQFTSLRPFAQNISFGIVVSAITLLTILIGELVPKNFPLSSPGKTALSITTDIWLFRRVTHPKILLKILRVKLRREQDILEEELKLLMTKSIYLHN